MAGPKLELTWPHKDEFLLVPKDEDGKPVWVARDHPAANEVRLTRFVDAPGNVNEKDPHLDNAVFVGDSFDAMRVMCEVPEFAARYRGKVKLIYADPPFNTGQAFTHYDDWMEHATWLSFMRDRLMLMKDLLAPDGSVWIHLDDAEAHRMRCLLDEVFGASNFIATVIWEKSYSPRNDSKTFSVAHDYILVYSRMNGWTSNRLDRTEANDKNYKNPDNDPRGPWASDNYTTNKTKEERKNLWYAITRPADGAKIWPPDNLTWRYSEERHRENEEAGDVWWGKDGLNNSPRFKRRLEGLPALIPMTLWKHTDVGHNDEAKKEIKRMFPDSTPFSTPKPERLLERVIHIGTKPGDLVFDPFAGSGTTAAVAHKIGRRWATSELSIDNVNEFVQPRLTKVVKGDDPGGVTESVGWAGGGEFRTVVVEPSLYEVGTEGMVFLREGVDSDDLSRAMSGQMRFTYTPEVAPFCGRRGRMLLAVIPGVVGIEEIDDLIARLPENTRLTLAAGALLPGAADHLTKYSRGSRALKIPRDVLTRTLRSATDAQPGETNG
jgi:adenine-specific DNA-methyltransferase